MHYYSRDNSPITTQIRRVNDKEVYSSSLKPQVSKLLQVHPFRRKYAPTLHICKKLFHKLSLNHLGIATKSGSRSFLTTST